MSDPRSLITEYIRALSGQPKTSALVSQYVSDEGLARHISDVEAAFPCYDILTSDMLAEGSKVVVRGEFRGIHRGRFAGIEPTGRAVSAGLIIIYAVADGRIVDHWMQFDLFTLMQQLQTAAAAQPA
jgi:predicted ester cyclase